ncbi:MAG TPA: hypothetical protein ENI05_10850 [Porticoccus sp.]|nr:hypothetical protein [Porticoccus sp.]
MSNLKTGSINPISIYFVLFGSSLLAAVILYGALPSTGIWESKGIQLSGAAAGFIIFFLLANRVFHSLQKLQIEQRNNNNQQRIDALEQKINQLKAGELPDIECPSNFETIISKDFGLGFSKPREWGNHPEQHVGIYMQPLDEKVVAAGFRGNIAVTVTPLDQLPGLPSDPKDIPLEALKGPSLSAKKAWSGGDISWNPTYVANRRAMKSTFNYTLPENPEIHVSVEGVVVLDEAGRKLFVFALHEAEQRAKESRQLFRQLISTVKFLS